MSLTLNRKAYIKLIQEDIEWLKKQENSLEKDHILIFLENELEKNKEEK